MSKQYLTRGVYFLPGRVTCPFASLGTRAANLSNRLVLDEDTDVTVDGTTIALRDQRAYAKKTRLVDLELLAVGVTADGRRIPFVIDLSISKTGTRYTTELHGHLRESVPLVRAEYEPFIVIAGGDVVFDQRIADAAVRQPSFALRVAKALMDVKDHIAGVTQDPAKLGYRVADLSIGVGMLGIGWMIARAQLLSLDPANAPLIAHGSVPDMLRDGAWEMRLSAMSDRWVGDAVKRDLFLCGIADMPLLAGVKDRGLRKGQTLAFRFSQGSGQIVLDGTPAPLPNALDIARAYLEFHVLGGIIADYAESGSRQRLRGSASTPVRARPARTR